MANHNKKLSSENIDCYKNSAIGILGGTFDPIHLGHTQSAQAVANELGLNKILLIPAHIPPHKASAKLIPQATPEQRATMVEIACQDSAILSCDQRELQRSGNSYTVDTLKELKQQYPKHALYFIVGMDSLMSFTRWYQYQDILSLCHLIVNARPNYSTQHFNEETKALLCQYQTSDAAELKQLASGRIFFTRECDYNVSSTQVREDLALQKSCQQQLLPAIREFIHKNKLYR